MLEGKAAQPRGLSTFRLHFLRFVYVGTFLFVGTNAWKTILTHHGPWDPLQGVAFSFWAAYATLLLLGLRHPLKFLPMLLLQLFYKVIWLMAVAYPLWSAGQLQGSAASMTSIFIAAVVVDLFAIPWPYAVRSYVLKDAAD